MRSIHFDWKFENPRTGNEPRCTSCHIGYGWEDMSEDPPRQSTVGTGWDDALPMPRLMIGEDMTGQNNAVDCLICHDRSGQ